MFFFVMKQGVLSILGEAKLLKMLVHNIEILHVFDLGHKVMSLRQGGPYHYTSPLF